MDRRKHSLNRAKALLLFVLLLVSVAAPVIDQTALCPMAQAAKAANTLEPTCCSHQSLAADIDSVTPLWTQTCDCPELSWDVSVADQNRQNGEKSAPVVSEWIEGIPLSVSVPARLQARMVPLARHVADLTPLWLQNQSIRC
ncbi:MAG: hypothetical protein IPN71_12175 [Fibrobacteres bacterium]|jgi:hypothetical protein|nr:hypothetical protein [Fibrobacterota bacterium]